MKNYLIRKILILSSILFLSTFKIFSQAYIDTSTIQNSADILFDSLSVHLNTLPEDTNRVNLLNEISWNYAPTNYHKSILFADSALDLATKLNWEKGIANALNNQGDALQYKGELDKAFNKYEQALKIFEKINEYRKEAISLAKLGITKMNLSDFSKAFSYYDKAHWIFRRLNDNNGLQKTNTYLGILLYKFKEYQKSLQYYKKALAISEELNDISTQASLYGNIGLTYLELEDYSKSIDYFNKALNISKKINDLYNYSIFLGNTGLVYYKLTKYSQAFKYYKNALDISEKIKDKYGVAYQKANIGEFKYKLATDSSYQIKLNEKNQLLSESILYLKEAVNEFSKLGLRKEKALALYSLSDTYKETNNYKKAYEVYSSAKMIQDTIFSLESKRIIAEVEVNQRLNVQEKEIKLLTKDREYQNYVRKSLFIFATLLLLITIAIFVLYFKIKKQNNKLKENIKIREEAEEALRKNQVELKKYQDHLESLVKERTIDLEKEIQERKLIEEDLLLAIERAEAASKAKSIFLANMSHELRTPLVGILGYSELLSKEVKDEETKEMAAGINRTGNKLLDTLSMVLDLARVESDKFEINIKKVEVVDLIKDVYQNFKAYADSKNLTLNLVLKQESIIIDTDPGMLKVVLDNLVNNAIKFTKQGHIEIEAFIEKKENNSFLIIKIKDTGIGIHKKDIPHIFSEFKQLSEGTIKEFPGTGLGLSITKKYVALLNGQISVKSSFGKGSIFIIEFTI